MKKYISIAVLSIATLTACEQTPKKEEVNKRTKIGIETVDKDNFEEVKSLRLFDNVQEAKAARFVNKYIAFLKEDKSDVDLKNWIATKSVTENFINAFNKTLADTNSTFDPVINSEEIPEKGFQVVSNDDQDYVTLQRVSNPSYTIKVKMVQVDGKWKVDGCGAVNIPTDKQ
ncbi:hypothetical protein [Neptunitalea lumnitzerae]|nr:hypothetical protein [Neptunitalea sp. Y10]